MGSWVAKWGEFRNVVDVGGDVTGGCVATRTGGSDASDAAQAVLDYVIIATCGLCIQMATGKQPGYRLCRELAANLCIFVVGGAWPRARARL